MGKAIQHPDKPASAARIPRAQRFRLLRSVCNLMGALQFTCSAHSLGAGLILLGNMDSAFYNSDGKKALERHAPPLMLFYHYVGMPAMMLPFVLVQEHDVFSRVSEFTTRTWGGLGRPILVVRLGERLTPLAVFGGLMVLGRTLIITIWKKLRRVPAPA